MTKFLKLNEITNNEIKPVLIRKKRIEYICMGSKGKDTYIKLTGLTANGKDSFIFVKESVEEVWTMMNVDYSKAPVLMTAKEYENYTNKTNGH